MTTKIAVKSRLTGALVGMATLDENYDGPLTALQRTNRRGDAGPCRQRGDGGRNPRL
jgi:hypothetical protein